MSSTRITSAETPSPACGSATLSGHTKTVHTLGWNCSGSRLGSGSADTTLRVWDLERHVSGSETELRGHTRAVEQLEWSPLAAGSVATVSADKSARVWDTRTGKAGAVFKTKGENINLAWSPDGRSLAVGNKDDLVSIIDVRKGTISATHKFPMEVNELAWDATGAFLFLTTGSGAIDTYAFPDMERLASARGHTGNCYCLDVAPAGDMLAAGSADALVSLWDVQDMVCVGTLDQILSPVRSVSFSHDGAYLAAGSEDPAVAVFSLAEDGDQVAAIPCDGPINALAWHPEIYLLAHAGDVRDKAATGARGGLVHIWGFPQDNAPNYGPISYSHAPPPPPPSSSSSSSSSSRQYGSRRSHHHPPPPPPPSRNSRSRSSNKWNNPPPPPPLSSSRSNHQGSRRYSNNSRRS